MEHDYSLRFFDEEANSIINRDCLKNQTKRPYDYKELVTYKKFQYSEIYRFKRLSTIVSLAREIMPILMKNPNLIDENIRRQRYGISSSPDVLKVSAGNIEKGKLGEKGSSGDPVAMENLGSFKQSKIDAGYPGVDALNAERLRDLQLNGISKSECIVHYFDSYYKGWTIVRERTKNLRLTGTFLTSEAVVILAQAKKSSYASAMRNATDRLTTWLMNRLSSKSTSGD